MKEGIRRACGPLSVIDLGFLVLRIVTVLGGIAWLLFAPLSDGEAVALAKALVAFSIYSTILYVYIFLRPGRIRYAYIASLVLDIVFVFYLVNFHRELNNSFFLGYYLLTALHTFYFGPKFGAAVATISGVLYFINITPYIGRIHWTDQALRIAFLYLIAIPLGLLSEKLRKDKERIEELNKRLEESIEYLKRMQTRLIEAEKLAAMGRLTYDIAHEIRNPLSALGGMARRLNKLLKKGTKEKEYVKVILSEAGRLEAILSDILILSSEQFRFELKRGNINEPIKDAVKFFCDICQEGKIRLEEEYLPDPPRVYFDYDQVKQAIGNLITNAIDAITPGGGTISVRTGTKLHNEVLWVTVSISDTGKPIPKDKLELIFQPFYSTKKIGVGTGLGLAIVQKIMEEHRGFIEVKSEEGIGTTFILHFPYQSEEEDKKTPCWEYIKCGIEKDPTRRCPAYPYFGRICWAIAGTMCEGRVMGTYAEKIHECRNCPFYHLCRTERNLPGKTPEDQARLPDIKKEDQ